MHFANKDAHSVPASPLWQDAPPPVQNASRPRQDACYKLQKYMFYSI
ncbi:MAG TPA: hypothetical protein DCZ76_04160 [Treponema sp.]|nr:hypothetical protein [Treponema sp.]